MIYAYLKNAYSPKQEDDILWTFTDFTFVPSPEFFHQASRGDIVFSDTLDGIHFARERDRIGSITVWPYPKLPDINLFTERWHACIFDQVPLQIPTLQFHLQTVRAHLSHYVLAW